MGWNDVNYRRIHLTCTDEINQIGLPYFLIRNPVAIEVDNIEL